MFEKYLDKVVVFIELVVAAVLVILSVLALAGLFNAVWAVMSNGFVLLPGDFNAVISIVLEVFILIELFRIALAYMSHKNVIPTVLEAALVAVARKFVVFEPKTDFLAYAAGHALLLVSVALAWWLLARASACDVPEDVPHSH